MANLTFEQLPQAVYEIQQKLESIEKLLLQTNKLGPATDEILTVHGAAEFLDISVATVYKMVSGREIPFMKRSKRVYFSKVELINYIKEGRRKTNLELEAEADEYLRKRRIKKGYF